MRVIITMTIANFSRKPNGWGMGGVPYDLCGRKNLNKQIFNGCLWSICSIGTILFIIPHHFIEHKQNFFYLITFEHLVFCFTAKQVNIITHWPWHHWSCWRTSLYQAPQLRCVDSCISLGKYTDDMGGPQYLFSLSRELWLHVLFDNNEIEAIKL